MRHLYPMLLDVTERTCVIIGGGEVAARKAAGLFDAGAKRVRVVSPQLRAKFVGGIDWIAAPYAQEHLDGASLVFAATDLSRVNDAVVRDARARGLIVSRADMDDDLSGDFITPAKLKVGPILATIAAGSAALSVFIRNEMEKAWEPRWTQMAEAMAELRPEILMGHADVSVRRRMFRELASEPAMDVLNTRGLPGLRAWLNDKYPDNRNGETES